MSKLEIPTYEQYKKATTFARFKYRFGFIVLVLCWLSLLFIIYYMVSHGEAIASNPLTYACGKAKPTLECHCYSPKTDRVDFYVNSSTIWIEELDLSNPTYLNITVKDLEDLFIFNKES